MNSRWGSSELHVISVRYSSGKTDLCPHLPLKGLFYLHEELWHSAPGLPDAGLILKKLPPVGKSFLLINTPFVLLIYLDLKQNSPWWIQGEGGLSKNNRCSGCFCLQALGNILMRKESATNRGEFRCPSRNPVRWGQAARRRTKRLWRQLKTAHATSFQSAASSL